MKLCNITYALIIITALFGCQQKVSKQEQGVNQPLVGTWHLIASKSITGGDTVITTPTKDQEMVKIFNGSDFAFFTHDLQHGKTTKPVYDSGSGTYKLAGNNYAEHLAYCNYREWENRDFKFTVKFKNDTLIQTFQEYS